MTTGKITNISGKTTICSIEMPFADILHIQHKPGLMAGIVLDAQGSSIARGNEFARNVITLLFHLDIVRLEDGLFRPV